MLAGKGNPTKILECVRQRRRMPYCQTDLILMTREAFSENINRKTSDIIKMKTSFIFEAHAILAVFHGL